jgi:tetratricopeptide (TPR) repeat protein
MKNWSWKKMQTREKKLEYLRKTIETLWHGVSDTKTGDYPRIISLYKEVLMHDYHDADSWENMIWLMWSMAVNNKDTVWLFQAEKFAKRYLSLNSNGYRAYEYLGQFYRIMYVDLRLAIRYYESAIRWKDAPSSTHHSLISVCDKTGDKVRAIGYCKMTLARFPNDPYTKSKLEALTKL